VTPEAAHDEFSQKKGTRITPPLFSLFVKEGVGHEALRNVNMFIF